MRAAIFAIAFALAGCSNFDYITADQCGNGVVEAGEDCDLVAGAPGAEACVACRHTCNPAFDFGFECPSGWGCGDDGVCRHGVLEYEESVPALELEVTDFVIDDLDGDPFPDAYGYGPSEIWLARGTPGPGFEIVTRYPRTRGDVLPALGRLPDDSVVGFSGGPKPDVAISPGRRAVALFGTGGGRLTPAPQTWFELGASATVTTLIQTARSAPFHDFASYDLFGGTMWIDRPGVAASVALAVPAPSPSCPANQVHLLAADLDGDDLDELLLGCTGASTVAVVDVIEDVDGDPELALLATLSLGAPLTGPLVLADLDDDGRVDLLGSIASGEFVIKLAVLHQTAAMTFAPAVEDTRLGDAIVLAAADLDADGVDDLVTSAGLELNLGATFARVASSPVAWRAAAIADVDDDGRLDVIGVADGELDTLLAATGSTYALHVTLVTGTASGIRAGDVDGDGLADVATLWSVSNDAVVRIRYGAAGASPALVDAGAFSASVSGFAVGGVSQADTLLDADGAAEIVVVTSAKLVSIFAGGGARPPLAPLDLTIDPRILALGRFAPIPSEEGATRLDLFVVGDPGQPSTVWYGVFDSQRELQDRHLFVNSITTCGQVPPVTAVGNITGDAGATLIELSCAETQGGVQASARRLVADADGAPLLSLGVAAVIGTFVPPVAVAIADLDNDQAPELITVNDEAAGGVRVLHNTGTSFDSRVVELGQYFPTAVDAANLDADPEVEIITSELNLRAYDYTVDGATPLLMPGTFIETEWSLNVSGVPRLHDLDGDGVADIVVGGDQLRVFRAVPHDER